MKERPSSVRLTMELLKTITALTWKPTITLSGNQPLELRIPDGQEEGNPEVEVVPERAPYRVFLTKGGLEKVGYSPGCAKCSAMRAGDRARTRRQHHHDACRARVEAEMNKDETLRRSASNTAEEQDEWLAKKVEQADAKNKKREEVPSSSGDPVNIEGPEPASRGTGEDEVLGRCWNCEQTVGSSL